MSTRDGADSQGATQPRDMPQGTYLASGPIDATGGSLLDDLLGEVTEARLERKLDDIAELAETVAERHRGDHDPAPEALLEALCRAEHAPMEFASLARRVDTGALTWQQIWDTPGTYDGGFRLVGLAVERRHADALALHGHPPVPDQRTRPESNKRDHGPSWWQT